MSLYSLEYITENDIQEPIFQHVKSGKTLECRLTPISNEILDSVFRYKTTILFTQGSLNLTSLIIPLFTLEKKQDVLIGIPNRLFHEHFEKNTEIFFSLIYKKKMDVGPSNSFFFYPDMLWCKGEIDDETNELIKLDISTRPKHGKLKLKRDYDNYAIDCLNSGAFKTKPKIVSIPIEEVTPAGIIGKKEIKFDNNNNYILENFNPKLIIYESINERRYSFDSILDLINKTETMDIRLVLHFSWPYLKGISAFLKKIKDNNNVNIIHLGKRICIESQKDFEKPKPDILPLSLEGRSWDIYYPKRRFFKFKIILPILRINSKNISAKDIEDWDWQFDERTTRIQKHLRFEQFDKITENLLRFPPVVDTFLCPSEIKIFSPLKIKTIPITEFISNKENENNHSVMAFKGLCSDIERFRDLSYEFNGLYTNSTVTKKTLFQGYFIEKINQLLNKVIKPDPNNKAPAYIFIANLYPNLKIQTSLTESLIYLFKSIDKALNSFRFPHIQKKENSFYIENELYNGDKLKGLFLDNNGLEESNINNIRRLFSDNNPEVDVFITRKNNELKLTLSFNLSFDYFEWQPQSSIANRVRLVFYEFLMKDNGSFNEYKLTNISFDQKNNSINLSIKHKSDIIPSIEIPEKITIVHSDFSKMQAFSEKMKTNPCELIIPGPIPFNTISGEDILISHGYDALLLPFENVIFFAYPGNNFKLILKQTKLYTDLLSENQTNFSKRDLLFSIDNTKNITRFNLLPKPQSINNPTDENEDTPFDTAYREELLDDSNVEENERDEIKTLKDIWAQIQRNPNKESQKTQFIHTPSKEYTNLYVEFENGVRDTIPFPVGILLRKKGPGGEYILTPIDELSPNDQIIYIQTDERESIERESIENYLKRTIFGVDEMSLEDILEPLTTIKNFYMSLRILDIWKNYDETKMTKLDWLSATQKENLFNLIRILLNKKSKQDLQNFLNNSIWQELIEPESLINIFNEGNRTLTQEKLYGLFVAFGSKNYTLAAFKLLCKKTNYEQTHYHFIDEINLLALGRLLGHQGIILNYNIINEKGMNIHNFLTQVGRSIQRVANGRGEFLHPIDNAIEQKMKKCTVVNIGSC